MLGTARDARAGARDGASYPRAGANRRAPGRSRPLRRRNLAHLLMPSLLALPERVGFRLAFPVAVAAWSIALVLSLACFEVLRW
jgi:hypothetical protein